MLDASLARYSTGARPTDYTPFTAVPSADMKNLGQLVDAVAEPQSQVAGTVV